MLNTFRLTFFILAYFVSSSAFPKEENTSIVSKTWPLTHFMIKNEPIMLKNTNGTYVINFPVPDRVEADSAGLTLMINNSNLLNAGRAQIVVFINDYVAGQVKLDPVNSETRAIFTIAGEYLKAGYNTLSFKVAQHYTDSQCEDWSSPELWTSINSVKSSLTLNYRLKSINESLADLNRYINAKLGEYSVSIIRGGSARSEAYLYAGAMLAQGIKLRLKYVPLQLDERVGKLYQGPESEGAKPRRFNIDPAQLTQDAILLGTKQQIGELIPNAIYQAIQGPYLGLFRQDINPHRFILVVSGTDDRQVKTAAQAFALLNRPLPDAADTIVQAIDFGDAASALGHRIIVPGSTYQFSQLGLTDMAFDTANTNSDLEFVLPPDIYSTEEAMVTLNLDLAYGAAMRKDSVINISLNGLFNHAVQLKEEGGAHYRNYQIDIPLRNFQPGVNRLTFESVMTPSEFGECAFIQRGNLKASIYRDSTITFPETGRVVTLPDLKLLETTGFPLINNGSAAHTVFILLDRSSDSLVSAWHFIAKLASINDAPVFDIQITDNDTVARQNSVLIGKPTIAKAGMFDDAPVKLGSPNRFPYRYKERQQAPMESLSEWLYRILLSDDSKPLAVEIEPENAVMTQTAGLGRNFLLMSYPSTHADDGVVFALVSEPEQSLYAGLTELLSPALWSQMRGNIFVWDDQSRFDAWQHGETFVSGEKSARLSLIMHFSKRPWQWLALIVSILVLTAWLIHRLLIRYKGKVHQLHEDAR
ncbi:MAG: cellulose biosynthesis cyclic di-GMP-binding regulatory protein BcsB [Gammaproteobacteria bacterium]